MTTYISDTFTGTDGTLLPSHTPDTGGAWVAAPMEYGTIAAFGTNYATTCFSIQSNQAAPNTNNATADNHIGNLFNISIGNGFKITCTLTTPATMNTARLAIAWRSNAATAIDTCDNWQFNIRPDLNDCRLRRIDDSVETVVAGPTSFTFATSTTYTITVIVNGDNFSCSVDATEIFNSSSSTYNSNGYVGIVKNTGNSAYRIDNFQVVSYPPSVVKTLAALGVGD